MTIDYVSKISIDANDNDNRFSIFCIPIKTSFTFNVSKDNFERLLAGFFDSIRKQNETPNTEEPFFCRGSRFADSLKNFAVLEGRYVTDNDFEIRVEREGKRSILTVTHLGVYRYDND